MEKRDCCICCNERTNFIKCQYCEGEACADCQQKFLLEKMNPKCMNCKKDWSYNWVREHFPKNFMNKTFKTVKENQLFELEKTMLPDLQAEVAFEMKYGKELEFYKDFLARLRRMKRYSVMNEEDCKEEDVTSFRDIRGYYSYRSQVKFTGIDYYQIYQKWEKETEKVKEKHINDKTINFVIKSEIRSINYIVHNIEKIIETRVDISQLQRIFGNYYYTWNINYHVKTNVVMGNLHFMYKEGIWERYIIKFFKTLLNVDIDKSDHKEGDVIDLIFSLYLNDKEELIFEFNGKDYLGNNKNLLDFLIPNAKLKKKNNITRPCPDNNCRGFFDNSYKCGMCKVHICKECHVILKEEEDENNPHKCNQDTVKSVKALERETKPCPKCSTLIFKVSGCDQMYCTQCHTAFSWETGEEDKGRIHNPHYWEFLRQQGKDEEEVKRQFGGEGGGPARVEVDNGCFIFQTLERYLSHTSFNPIFQIIYHLENHDLPKFEIKEMENLNLDLRKEYLKKNIDEKKFKTNLSMRFKRNNFNIEGRQIMEMFINTIKDTTTLFFKNLGIQKMDRMLIKYIDTRPLFKSIKTIQEYAIKNMQKICDIYGYVLPKIEAFSPYYFDFFNVFLDKEKQKSKDITNLEETLKFLLDLEWTKSYTQEYLQLTPFYTKYNIRNPIYFPSADHFLKYKEDKMNKIIDEIDKIKNL